MKIHARTQGTTLNIVRDHWIAYEGDEIIEIHLYYYCLCSRNDGCCYDHFGRNDTNHS
jgi:hypothetical protein